MSNLSSGNKLPQLNGKICLTEGGIETYMQYKKGHELRSFCLFDLMNDPKAVADLRVYHERLIEVALKHKVGAILDGIHYRTSKDWGELLGYSAQGLKDITIQGIEFYKDLARQYETADSPMPISGVVGPRGDAYAVGHIMSADEAQDYHSEQLETMKLAGADFATALTFNQVYEAIGVARAAHELDFPVVISFALGANGKLKTGPGLGEAITAVDQATNAAPAYFMVNCTHPVDFAPAFDQPGRWTNRLRGLRPNASSLAHGVLCQLGHLEEGNPAELAQQMAAMAERFPHISVWGGCCGTDYAHIDKIAAALLEVCQSSPVTA